MIDVHCHLLPGLDDGPATDDLALDMARMAVAAGTRGIICTPHRHRQGWTSSRALVEDRVAHLRGLLDENAIDLSVWPGSELALDFDLLHGLQSGELASLNGGSWILLELPGMVRPPMLERYMQDLMDCGYRIILAHPERYRYVQTHPGIVFDWVSAGVCVQLTASQVAGDGGRSGALTTLLLEHNLVHFLASDGHNITWRPPVLGDGVRVVRQMFGPEAAERLTQFNPELVVTNRPLPADTPAPLRPRFKKKSWFTWG